MAIIALDKLKIDDPVGAISVHGVVGLFGLLIVPFTKDSASFGWSVTGRCHYFCLGIWRQPGGMVSVENDHGDPVLESKKNMMV